MGLQLSANTAHFFTYGQLQIFHLLLVPAHGIAFEQVLTTNFLPLLLSYVVKFVWMKGIKSLQLYAQSIYSCFMLKIMLLSTPFRM